MPAVKYTLIFPNLTGTIPTAVCGASRKTWGHALYNEKLRCQTFSIDQQKWEGLPGQRQNSAAFDICKSRTQSRTHSFYVIAEAIPDPGSPEVKLAEALSEVQAKLADSERARDAALAELSAIQALVSSEPAPVQPDKTYFEAALPVIEPAVTTETVAIPAETITSESVVIPLQEDKPTEQPVSDLIGSYRELRAIATVEGVKNVSSYTNKESLRAAIETHRAIVRSEPVTA